MATETSCRTDIATQLGSWPAVADFAPHLRIAHQVAGRVRLKLAATPGVAFLRTPGGMRLPQALTALGACRGVRDIQFNLLARSCIIEYDNRVIPDRAWPDLLGGRQTPAAAALAEILREKTEASFRRP